MRRIRLSMAVVAALAVSMAMGSSVLGQDENRRGHPVLGSWIVEATSTNAADAPELVSYHVDGSVRGAGPQGASLGTWESTGERSADVTLVASVIDPMTGAFLGLGWFRGSLEVSRDGQRFSGTFTFEPPAAFSAALGAPEGQLGPADVTGERIAVEPMGETVAPIPDFSQLGPAAPDGSPVPGASPLAPEASPAA